MAQEERTLMVEASCLTWIYVNLVEERVTRVRVHALPENVVVSDSPDVVPVDADTQPLEFERRRAIMIARSTRLPFPFELMV